MSPADSGLQGMLRARAVGYLLKEEAPEVIVAAVRAAARLSSAPLLRPRGAGAESQAATGEKGRSVWQEVRA